VCSLGNFCTSFTRVLNLFLCYITYLLVLDFVLLLPQLISNYVSFCFAKHHAPHCKMFQIQRLFQVAVFWDVTLFHCASGS
jgi:hypothetical protein